MATSFLPGAAARAAIDFTPRYLEVANEGYVSKVLSVRRDARTIFLTPPPRWIVSGNAARMTLACAEIPQAEIQFGVATQPVPTGEFDAPWVEEARQRLLKSLPKESTEATVTTSAQPLNNSGWKSYELTVTYNYFGDRLQKSVCVIRVRGVEAIELTTFARKGNFEQVHRFAFDMAQSWSAPPPMVVQTMLRK